MTIKFPLPLEYNEAIQNPRQCFDDPELKNGSPTLNNLGLPRPSSGNFASVYQITSNGKKYAVKCFLRYDQDREFRYENISSYLNKTNLGWAVHFSFVVRGIKVNNQWYPILKMEWIDGIPLNLYVEQNLNKPAILQDVAKKFYAVAGSLQTASIAHGDLQHGNILVSQGKLRLVDYDGMFVTGLKGLPSQEIGHPNYQHPKRSGTDFDLYIDNFSAWVIYISIKALSIEPTMWHQIKGAGDDTIIFRQSDFENPYSSATIQYMTQSSNANLRALADNLRDLVRLDFTKVPMLVLKSQVKNITGLGPQIPPKSISGTAFTTPSIGSSWIRDHIKRDPLPVLKFPDDLVVSEAKNYQIRVESASSINRVRLTLRTYIGPRYKSYPIVVQKKRFLESYDELIREKTQAEKLLIKARRNLGMAIKKVHKEIERIKKEMDEINKEILATHAQENEEISKIDYVNRHREQFIQDRLQHHWLDKNQIGGVGEKRVNVLRWADIRTAADITDANRQKGMQALDRIHRANGYNEWGILEEWRKNLETEIVKHYVPPIVVQPKQDIQKKYQDQRQALKAKQDAKQSEVDFLQNKLNGIDPQLKTLQDDIIQKQKQVDTLARKKSDAEVELAQYSEITPDKFLEALRSKLPANYQGFALIIQIQRFPNTILRSGFLKWITVLFLVSLVPVLWIVLSQTEVFQRHSIVDAIQVEPSATVTATNTPTLTPTPIPLGFENNPVHTNSEWTIEAKSFNGFEMVLVPTGCLVLSWEDGDTSELEVQQVCFEQPFWIDKYEITNERFGSNGRWTEPNLPRESVTWFDAAAFCTSRGARLPTEVEWEYAARGPDGLEFPWGNDFVANYLNYDDSDGKRTMDVGSYPENLSWVGSMDMSGNVWEWTISLDIPYPYDPLDGREGPENQTSPRVIRGGGFETKANNVKTSSRLSESPNNAQYDIGFRCVQSY